MNTFGSPVAFVHTQRNALGAHGSMGDNLGPAIGLILAAGTSLVLWVGLAQVARWAAYLIG